MKVAFYFTNEISPNTGGTERVTYAISHQLQKLGVDYIYISLNEHKSEGIIDAHQYYLPNDNCLICDDNIRFVDELIKQKQIDILVNQDSFDVGNTFCTRRYFPNVICVTVIHYNLFGSSTYVNEAIKESYLLGKTHALKYAIQCLAMPYYKYKAKKQRTEQLQAIYNKVDYVILLSEADKKVYPVVDKQRLFVIPNPITLPPIAEKPHKGKHVLYVGRMVYNPKRVDYLLRAWKIVESKHPDWVLDLLGGGDCLDYYKKLSQDLKLKNVVFYGNQPPSEFYKRASVFCLTSSYEGFGLVLTEAMQAGAVPVAFKSFDAVYDIIHHERDGLLVSPFDIKEYASAILRLIEDEKLRMKMSDMAKKKTDKFAIDKIGNEWFALFDTILR